jgi:D-arabinose 1-dehydrogenase-like Zn-dependent alcohol dehydrogenase
MAASIAGGLGLMAMQLANAGSYTGTLTDLTELLSLAGGVIKSVVSDTFKLNRAKEAPSMLKAGHIIGGGGIRP